MTEALCEPDEELAWDAICALQWRGTHEILGRAARLCESSCAFERRVGAKILGQLGLPDRSFPGECLRVLLGVLEAEQDHGVLRAILIALSHLGRPEAVLPACRYLRHVDPEVRHGVVLALMGHEDPQALVTLAELTKDREIHVRDWATFALGTQVEADTPDLREALADRLTDEDDDTRAEAIVGLARRGDRRMLPALREDLACGSVGTLAVEAAALIGEPLLYPLLEALQGSWDVDVELLEEALRTCSRG
ncbi:MAG: HEAT repeat domain-containing protein [Isosphaeraceae bacterium]